MVEASTNRSLESVQDHNKYLELSKMAVVSLLQPEISENSVDDLVLRGVFTKLNPKRDLINDHARFINARKLNGINPLEFDDSTTVELYDLLFREGKEEAIGTKKSRLLFAGFLVSGFNLVEPNRIVTQHGVDESGNPYTKEAFTEAYKLNLDWAMKFCRAYGDNRIDQVASEMAVCMELF